MPVDSCGKFLDIFDSFAHRRKPAGLYHDGNIFTWDKTRTYSGKKSPRFVGMDRELIIESVFFFGS
jgi:hypothetical protein